MAPPTSHKAAATTAPSGELPAMTPSQYMEERLDDQINWYDRESQRAQATFKRLRTAEIVLATIIPFAAGYAEVNTTVGVVIGVCGALVVVIASLLSLKQYQENWIHYRTTCETLKHEKFLFLTRSDPYHVSQPYLLLVKRVEALISREHSAWTQNTRAGADDSKPPSSLY